MPNIHDVFQALNESASVNESDVWDIEPEDLYGPYDIEDEFEVKAKDGTVVRVGVTDTDEDGSEVTLSWIDGSGKLSVYSSRLASKQRAKQTANAVKQKIKSEGITGRVLRPHKFKQEYYGRVIESDELDEGMGRVSNLSGFKRYLKNGGRIKLVKQEYLIRGQLQDMTRTHRQANVVRVATRVQTNGAYFAPEDDTSDERWLDFGNASDWSFSGNRAVFDEDWDRLTYELVDESRIYEAARKTTGTRKRSSSSTKKSTEAVVGGFSDEASMDEGFVKPVLKSIGDALTSITSNDIKVEDVKTVGKTGKFTYRFNKQTGFARYGFEWVLLGKDKTNERKPIATFHAVCALKGMGSEGFELSIKTTCEREPIIVENWVISEFKPPVRVAVKGKWNTLDKAIGTFGRKYKTAFNKSVQPVITRVKVIKKLTKKGKGIFDLDFAKKDAQEFRDRQNELVASGHGNWKEDDTFKGRSDFDRRIRQPLAKFLDKLASSHSNGARKFIEVSDYGNIKNQSNLWIDDLDYSYSEYMGEITWYYSIDYKAYNINDDYDINNDRPVCHLDLLCQLKTEGTSKVIRIFPRFRPTSQFKNSGIPVREVKMPDTVGVYGSVWDDKKLLSEIEKKAVSVVNQFETSLNSVIGKNKEKIYQSYVNDDDPYGLFVG